MPDFEFSMLAGETPTLHVRQHPVIYLRAAVWATLAIVLTVIALLGRDPRFWGLGGLLIAAAAAVAAFEAACRRKTTALAITDRRVMLWSGLIERRLSEAFPAALAGFELSQGPLGRLLGYGWLRIRGLEPALWLAVAEPGRVRSALEAFALRAAVPVEITPQPEPPACPQTLAKVYLSLLKEAVLDPPRKNNGAAPPKPDRPTRPLRPLAEVDRF